MNKTDFAILKKSGVIIIFFIFFTNGANAFAQFDSIAIAILDSMTDGISRLETCNFKIYTEYDIQSDKYGLITHSEIGDVYLKGPDKLFINKKGDKGHKEFFYDGNTFLVYSFDKNQYASTELKLNLIELIDSISRQFNVEFPGADVLYPDFTDNILENSQNLVYLGLTLINDIECYHIVGVQEEFTFQLWITADGNYLPVKISLDYINKPNNPRYRAVYLDWKSDIPLEDSMFVFKVPAGATKIKIVNK
ncbi:MAG: hypothetical protein HGGPFJEG_03033 [Ignavibacteria bacterium]|nr:hypothetical protein [Ignavibacteria bacterium]